MLVKRLRPRMSASDSDNSIDWLASDDEDNESEPELACSRMQAQPPAPPSPRCPRLPDRAEGDSPYSSEPKEGEEEEDVGGWGGSGEDSGQGSPASRTAESHAGVGLRRSERSKCRKTQQAQKRSHSPEHKERQFMSNQPEKNRFFTTKCKELQCYILPLSSILNGLRTGRYRERLSSFQESVAMDRIQRIMGVLQKPCMGERYIDIILKMEEMLKSWFPNMKPREEHMVAHTEEPAPTKKPKLSASTTVGPFTGINAPTAGAKALRVTDLTPPGTYSAGNVKRLHSALSGPLAAGQGQQGAPPFPALTQDSAVSSSTDSGRAKTDSAPGRPRPAKINAPCLERLLKSTESIIGRNGKAAGGVTGGSCS